MSIIINYILSYEYKDIIVTYTINCNDVAKTPQGKRCIRPRGKINRQCLSLYLSISLSLSIYLSLSLYIYYHINNYIHHAIIHIHMCIYYTHILFT